MLGGNEMISVKTKSFEYRVSKVSILENGKPDCFAQRKREDGSWGKVESTTLRRLLAEIALKQTRGVRNIGYQNDNGRISRLSKKKKRAC